MGYGAADFNNMFKGDSLGTGTGFEDKDATFPNVTQGGTVAPGAMFPAIYAPKPPMPGMPGPGGPQGGMGGPPMGQQAPQGDLMRKIAMMQPGGGMMGGAPMGGGMGGPPGGMMGGRGGY